MSIKAVDVKNLREKTGLGMMECKKALEESQGNLEEAITNLRKNSALKAEKKSSRTAVEGIIVAEKKENDIVFVEINCETDFVAKDNNFIDFCNESLNFAIENLDKNNIEFKDAIKKIKNPFPNKWLLTKIKKHLIQLINHLC